MWKQQAVIAFLVFALGGVVGIALGNAAAADSAPTTTASAAATTTTVPKPLFVEPGETVVGPAVVIPGDLSLDGEQVVLDFDMISLAPVGDAPSVAQFLGFQAVEEVPAADLDTVFLDRLVLSTTAGHIPGMVANPAAHTVRFDVGEGFSLDSVTGVKLDSYAILTPVEAEFTLDLANETAQVAPGMTARLLAVTEQARTIVQVELISTRGFNYDHISLTGAGPGWKSAVREAEGRPRWNLTYDAAQAPDPIPLRIAGAIWIPIESGAEVAVTK